MGDRKTAYHFPLDPYSQRKKTEQEKQHSRKRTSVICNRTKSGMGDMAIDTSQAEGVIESQPQSTTSSVSSAFHNTIQNNASAEQNGALVGSSVVHNLMSVYESLTQSSTPQTALSHPPQQKAEHPAIFESHPPNHQTLLPQPHMSAPIQHSESHHSLPQDGLSSTDQMYHPPHHPHQIQYQQPIPPYGAHTFSSFQQPYGAPVPHQQSYASLDQTIYHQQSSDSEDVENSRSESRRKRRESSSYSSNTSKGRKKSKSSDGRWSKRFTWPDELHRDFVSAIFDVGLKHSSPSTIMEHMPKHRDITTERIKSHLQKYRLHRAKSKQEFMSCYQSSLTKFQENGTTGTKAMSNGECAAHITYLATTDPKKILSGPGVVQTTPGQVQPTVQYAPRVNEALVLPQLTEAEKNSPIGASMGYLMGLFLSLKQELAMQRSRDGIHKRGNTSHAVPDVYGNKAPAALFQNIDTSQQKQTHQPEYDSTSTVKEGSPMTPHPNSRNMETFMNQEMKNQRVLQNKMRAMKQQELNKCKNGKEEGNESPLRNGEVASDRVQFTPESRVHEGRTYTERNRGMTIGSSEDFWNTDIVDDQLFEFLINN
jgi:SHAQKYF class myb-like DNA-binding protein